MNIAADYRNNSADSNWRSFAEVTAKLREIAGYPPDLQDAAVQTVLQQAEALSEQWAA